MYRISITTTSSLASDLEALEKEYPKKVLRPIVRQLLPKSERLFDRVIRYQPPAPDYPIKWKSERQRRYVLAKLKRERNLPYKRTGQYARGWEVSITLERGVVSIVAIHEWDGARFVGGEDQQPFLTKWPRIDNEVLEIGAQLENDIEQIAIGVIAKQLSKR
jgi:hypothetical protein